MERSAWPKNVSPSSKRAIKELLHGQNPTKKLRDLFDAHSQTGNNTRQPLFAEDLVVSVLGSFSNTLSESMSADSDEVLQVPTNACVMSELSEGSESIHTPDPRNVGRLFVKGTGKPAEILTKLNEMAGYSPDQEIELYEEKKIEPNVICEPVDKKVTFRASQIVHFRSLEKPKEDDFSLEMSKLYTYDDVVERVARQLGLDDASKIRLTSHNCYSQQPKSFPIKYRGVDCLSDMLVHYIQSSDILYYEVLDIPLPELQGLKVLKVAFHHATKDEVVSHTIRLPKQSTVGDVLSDLKTKVKLSEANAELRLLEVFYHKIYTIFPLNVKIEKLNNQYWTLRAEEIPEEEKNLGPNDRLIHVYHFTKDTAQNQMQIRNFGEPFVLVIHDGETLAEIKGRVQKKLQVPDEEFAKWRFAFVLLGRPEYLQDHDIVSNRFQGRDAYGGWVRYLGLEHPDTAPKRAYAANQNRHTFEKPVQIYNYNPMDGSSLTVLMSSIQDAPFVRGKSARWLWSKIISVDLMLFLGFLFCRGGG